MRHEGPIRVELEEKRYAFCACGRSATYPFCDGAHKTSGERPCVVECARAGTAVICGCLKSANFPYCDGSHRPPRGAEPEEPEALDPEDGL